MVRFRKAAVDARSEETPQVRQYRYVLRTAPPDALLAINAAALGRLSREDRRSLLTVIQERLLAGNRLTADQVDDIARLLSMGERRAPGSLLRHAPGDVLDRLAAAALGTEGGRARMAGYADWDGRDPEPLSQGALEKEFARPGRSGEDRYKVVKGMAEGGFGT